MWRDDFPIYPRKDEISRSWRNQSVSKFPLLDSKDKYREIKIYRSDTHPKSHSPHNDATACSGHEWRFRRGKYVNHFDLTPDACMLRLTSPRICCGDLSRVPALLTRHARCALPCYRIIHRLYNAVDTIIRVGIAGTAISRILSSQKRRQLPLPVKRHEQVYVADVAAM